MNNERILRFGLTLFSAAALNGFSTVKAQLISPPAPPLQHLLVAPPDAETDDEADRPRQKRKEVRVERDERRIERRDRESDDVVRERHRDDGERGGEKRIERFEYRRDKPEPKLKDKRRVFRFGPDEGQDMIIRRFPNEGGMRFETRRVPRPTPFGPGVPGRPGERLQHFNEAIRHLHEAGLHDVAEKLERQRDTLVQEFRGRNFGGGGPEDQLAKLRKEQDALRKELEKLKRALKETRPGHDEERREEQEKRP